jgi:amino acid transporter
MVDLNHNPKLKLICVTCVQLTCNVIALCCLLGLSLSAHCTTAEYLIFGICTAICLLAALLNSYFLRCLTRKPPRRLRAFRVLMVVAINVCVFLFIAGSFYLFITFGRRWSEVKTYVPHALTIFAITFCSLLLNSFSVYYLELVIRNPNGSRDVYFSAID